MSAAAVDVVATSGERSRRKGRRGVIILQVKLCDPRLSALSVVATIKALYKYTSFLFSFLYTGRLCQVQARLYGWGG